MPSKINGHDLRELSHEETSNEVLINTQSSTTVHIRTELTLTVIRFPFGNKFEIDGDEIIIHSRAYISPQET